MEREKMMSVLDLTHDFDGGEGITTSTVTAKNGNIMDLIHEADSQF